MRRQRFDLDVMSRRVRFVLLAAVVLTASVSIAQAFSQETHPASAKPGPQSYTLDGVVINALTGKPISGAKAQITGRSPVFATSGPEGKFHFENIDQARVSLEVQKDGFFWEKEPSQWFTAFIQIVDPRAKSPQVIVRLVPAAVITGRVVDSDGQPVANLSLRLFRSYVWEGLKIVRTRSGAVTDHQGEFRFDWLTPGTYYLRSSEGFGGPNGEGLPATYYGGSRDLEAASAITVVPGQDVKVDFRIPREVFYQVSGRVTGLPPGSRFSVRFVGPDGQTDYLWQVPGANPMGHFGASVPAGIYIVRAYSIGWSNTPNGIVVRRIKVSSDISDLVLTMGPLLTVPMHVQPDRELAPNIDLTRMSGLFAGQGFPASFGPPAGPSEIPNLEPGTYRAQIETRAPWYVASARSGDTNLLAEDLTVSAKTPVQPIEIVLRDDVATIDGNVSFDGRPTSGVVLLIPKYSPRQAVNIPVGPTGEFQMANLPPGEYSAWALDHVDGLAYANSEVMRKYSSREKVIRVPPHGHITVNLELQEF